MTKKIANIIVFTILAFSVLNLVLYADILFFGATIAQALEHFIHP